MAPLIVKQEVTKADGSTVTKVGFSPGAFFAALFAGALLMIAGIVYDAIDIYFAIQNKQQPHGIHLSIGLGIFVFGVAVAFTHFVLDPLNRLTVIISNSSLPVICGRRAGDPPAPPPGPPPQGPTI